MAFVDIEVLQHVSVFHVAVEDDAVIVDLYGGEDSVCGTVTYHFEDRCEQDEHVRTLSSWADSGADVTYLKRGGVVVLMDEVAFLRENFAK